MLPTPSTSHVPFDRIYEPAEDSYLLLDTLSSAPEHAFLSTHFPPPSPAPLVLEVGTGSGVVLAFLTAHAHPIFGRADILSLGIDINVHASLATQHTVAIAAAAQRDAGERRTGTYLGNGVGDLTAPVRARSVDVLVFNPPYVPTPELPAVPVAPGAGGAGADGAVVLGRDAQYELDSRLLELSYAGGVDGMEVTERLLGELPRVLSARGVAYVLLCAQNKPEAVMEGVRGWEEGGRWSAEVVGRSGKVGGWEKLVIVRIWRV